MLFSLHSLRCAFKAELAGLLLYACACLGDTRISVVQLDPVWYARHASSTPEKGQRRACLCMHLICLCPAVNCILHWAVHKEATWCPQCRVPFSQLLTYRKLDGSLRDFPASESVCLLKRTAHFQEYMTVRLAQPLPMTDTVRCSSKSACAECLCESASPATPPVEVHSAWLYPLICAVPRQQVSQYPHIHSSSELKLVRPSILESHLSYLHVQAREKGKSPALGAAGDGAIPPEVMDWQDYGRFYDEYDDDEEVENYYFSAAAGRARIILGNRRWGENGFVSSGRMQARPVAPARPAKVRGRQRAAWP